MAENQYFSPQDFWGLDVSLEVEAPLSDRKGDLVVFDMWLRLELGLDRKYLVLRITLLAHRRLH